MPSGLDATEPMGRPRRGGVRVEDGDDVRLLDALEQKVDFDVGLALVSVIYFGALAEEGIGFVEKKNGTTYFGRAENPI